MWFFFCFHFFLMILIFWGRPGFCLNFAEFSSCQENGQRFWRKKKCSAFKAGWPRKQICSAQWSNIIRASMRLLRRHTSVAKAWHSGGNPFFHATFAPSDIGGKKLGTRTYLVELIVSLGLPAWRLGPKVERILGYTLGNVLTIESQLRTPEWQHVHLHNCIAKVRTIWPQLGSL